MTTDLPVEVSFRSGVWARYDLGVLMVLLLFSSTGDDRESDDCIIGRRVRGMLLDVDVDVDVDV